MKSLKVLFSSALVVIASSLQALTISSGEVKFGEWNNNFTIAKEMADSMNVPMLAIWTKNGCSQCSKLKNAADTAAFKQWQKEKNILFVLCEDKTTDEAKECRLFVKHPTSTSLPYVCVYWKKSDGTEVKQHFIGRNGEMPSKSGGLDAQLMNSVELYTADFTHVPPYSGGDFLVPGSVGSRLEYIPGVTKTVAVPLIRTNGVANAAANVLKVGSVSHDIAWAAGEKSKTVPVDVSNVTGNLRLSLYDGESERASSLVYAVTEPENSVRNPSFVGEDFTWGEWTMDYAAAKTKVAADPDARLLAVFSGVLWCPYCTGIENSLFASSKFKQWASENKVALVLFDQGRATSPATAAGNKWPRLVTYESDPSKAPADAVSGAAYVSRKGITAAQATAYMNNVSRYTAKWLAPGSTAARLGNPTILLIDPDTESVRGRLVACRDADRVYDPEENVARLAELVESQGDGELDGYLSTTTQSIPVGGEADGELDVNSRSRYYKVTGLGATGRLKISAVCDGDVSLALWDAAGTQKLATGTDFVAYSFLETPPSELYLEVSAYGDASSVMYAKNGDTGFAFSLKAEILPIPGEIAFDQADFKMFKHDRSVTLSVTRKNGSSGECKVSVARVGGTAENGVRYDWQDKTFTWQDGESGTKSFVFEMKQDVPYMDEETVVLQLLAVSGEADVSLKRLTITLTDTDKPTLAKTEYDILLYKGFNASLGADGTVYNIKGDRVKLKKTSGRLPSGVKISYDDETQSVSLSKKTSKVGEFSAEYQISDGVETSEPIVLNFTVVDPADINKNLGKTLNATLPVFKLDGDTRELVGQLEFSMARSNKLKVKYTCTATKKSTTVSGYWDGLDEGAAYTTLTTKTGVRIAITLAESGAIAAEVLDPAYGSEALDSGEFMIPSEDYSGYRGVYTVALMPASTEVLAEPAGIGYVVIKFTSSSAVKKGKASCSILFPDGKKTSLSSSLVPIDDEFAALVLFKRASKNTILGVLKIRNNGASASNHRAVRELDDTEILWDHDEAGYSFTRTYQAFGSYISSVESLSGCCDADVLEMRYDFSMAAPSEEKGQIVSVLGDGKDILVTDKKLSVAERTSGFSVSYSKSTGVAKGKCKISFADGTIVSGTYAGVVIPDWYDCGCEEEPDIIMPIERSLPFVCGSVWFKDIVEGRNVTRSIAFGMGAD